MKSITVIRNGKRKRSKQIITATTEKKTAFLDFILNMKKIKAIIIKARNPVVDADKMNSINNRIININFSFLLIFCSQKTIAQNAAFNQGAQ